MRDDTRSSRSVVRVAMDACCVSAVQAVRTKTRQRTAKSCGPGAATLASIRPACAGSATVTIKAAHRGEHEVSRKPLRGESRDVSAVPVKLVCVLHYPLHTAMRAQSAPGFPCALCSKREQTRCRTQAIPRRENESACLSPSLRGAKRRPFSACSALILRSRACAASRRMGYAKA